MAAKRISQSSINWAALAERVPPDQKVQLTAFKAKSDTYLRRVLANPPEPPKFDWAAYKKKVPVSGMVDNFQKQYESLKIAYPQDTLTNQVDAQWNEVKKDIEAYCKASNEQIAVYEKEIARINAMIPYEQMTMEDFRDVHPELAIDPINKPTFWPHNAEEQLDYIDPEKAQSKDHH